MRHRHSPQAAMWNLHHCLVASCRIFPDGWTARWRDTSTTSGLVGGGSGEVVLPTGTVCVQVCSYRAELSRQLDDKVSGLIAHISLVEG